jgi:ATP-grasp domain
MVAMRDVLLICPAERDLAAVGSAGVGARYRVRPVGSDADGGERFEPAKLLRAAIHGPADGVVGTRDRSALLAALVAGRRGLPGPSALAVLRCQHKLNSRLIQQRAVPAAVPRFADVNGRPPFAPPFFVKPVVGRLSQGSFRVDRDEQLPRPLRDGYRDSFAAMAELAGVGGLEFGGHVAEEVVSGREATLEGYVHEGRLVTIGVTDSVFYPGTRSFQRFEYPSSLPRERQDELAAVAALLLPALGFDGGFFNLEFAVPASGPARIIEANARIASQFAPLVQTTHGRSTYDALFALACGEDPAWAAGAPDGFAVSWVVRVFADAFVDAVPDASPGLELLARPGARLSEQGVNDGESYRLAIFSEHGPTREEAVRRCEERAAALLDGFALAPAYTVAHGT